MALTAKSLAEFETYEAYLVKQINSMEKRNENVKGLTCSIEEANGRKQIDYRGSKFDRVSRYIKLTYGLSPHIFNPEVPSFVRIFKDIPNAYCLPVNLFFTASPVSQALELANLPDNNNNAKIDFEAIDQDKIFAMAGDDIIQKRFAKQIPAIQDMLTQCKDDGKTVLGQALAFKFPNQLHMIAFVGWYDKGKEKMIIGIYDSIYYERGPENNYRWAMNFARISFRLLFATLGCPVETMNLSEFCLRGPKGLHCPQYTINAEYCSMYSLYFLYVYAKLGMPREEAGLRRAVNDAFIVEPGELKRNPCEATNRFRLQTMGFILTVIVLYGINDDSVVSGVKSILDDVYDEGRGVQLIHPELHAILDASVPANHEGGRRRSTRRRSKKRARRHSRRRGV